MARGRVLKRGSTWSYIIDVGTPQDRKQRWRGGFRTKREATSALADIQSSLDRGEYVEQSRITLGQFLTDEWLPAVASTVRPSTLASYRLHVRRYVVPRLGTRVLQQLTAPV